MASLVLAGLLVVGCSGGDDPVLDPTPTSTEDVSPEPTDDAAATPTKTPAPEADPTPQLEAEITAFFKEYIKTSDESWSSKSKLELRRKMFADSCELCLAGYRLAEDALANDLRFDGAPGTVRDVNVTTVENEVLSVLVTIDAPAAKLIDVRGNVVESFEANPRSQVVYQVTRREEGLWLIIQGDVLS